jgi:hypothetical protein
MNGYVFFCIFKNSRLYFIFPGNHSASLYLRIRGRRERTLKASRLLSCELDIT